MNTKALFRRAGAPLALVAALTLLEAPATAATEAQYIMAAPVGYCQNGGTTGTPEYPWEGVFNKSTTQNLYLDCSLPNNTGTTSSSDYLDLVYIFATDNSSAEDITCNVKLVTATGTVTFTHATTTLTGTGAKFFNMSGMNGLHIDGNAYVSCKLPKATGTTQSTKSGINGILTGGSITR